MSDQVIKLSDLGLSIRGINEASIGADKAKAIDDPNVSIDQRNALARDAWNNFDLDKVPDLAHHFKDRSNLPSWMYEDERRRHQWAFLFENASSAKVRERYAGGRNCAERRNIELALDNTIEWLVGTYLDDVNYPLLHKLQRGMSAEKFCHHFLVGEGSSITQFPAQVLTMVRQLIPELLSSEVFSFMTIDRPSVKVPVMDMTYGQDMAPFTLDGSDLFFLNDANSTWHYSGGAILNYPVGTGNAVAVNFDLPVSGVRELLVFLNGAPTTAYTLAAGAGAGGRDQIQFAAAPGNGVVITAQFVTSPAKGERGRDVDVAIRLVSLVQDTLKLSATVDTFDMRDARLFYQKRLMPEVQRAMIIKIRQDLEAHCVLNALNSATGGYATWIRDGYRDGDVTTGDRNEYKSTINELVTDMEQFLFRRFGRRPTWYVVGDNIATRLLNLRRWALKHAMGGHAYEGEQVNLGLTTPIAGDRTKRFYQSPHSMPSDKALAGWRPSNPFDATYIVGVELPFYTTGVVQDGQGALRQHTTTAMRYAENVVKPRQMSTGELIAAS